MEKNFQWWLVKIDRFAAWTLLAVFILFFISGYGMTKGIINTQLAVNLHENILIPVGLVAFVVHTFLALRLTLMRWRKWNRASFAWLILIYLGLIVFFAYVEFFYRQPLPIKTPPVVETPAELSTENNLNATQKAFTIEELAQYDGKNGNPAYVAVDGIVYDVSTVFANSTHYGHLAGQELTTAFYSRHTKDEITKYPIIGILQP